MAGRPNTWAPDAQRALTPSPKSRSSYSFASAPGSGSHGMLHRLPATVLSSSSGGTGGLSHSLHRRPALGGSIHRLDTSLPTRTPFGAALSLPSLPPLGGSTRSLLSQGGGRA